MDDNMRMTAAQLSALWELCGRYNVPFREDEWQLNALDSHFMAGYVEGYIGNEDTNPYVAVHPDGTIIRN